VQLEAKSWQNPERHLVVRQNFSDDASQALVAANLDEPAQQFAADTLALPRVADQQGDLRIV
jgi:hypothetical protein